MLGIDCHLILRTKDVKSDIGLEGNLLIDQLVNAKISLVNLTDYKKYGQTKLLDILADKLKTKVKALRSPSWWIERNWSLGLYGVCP